MCQTMDRIGVATRQEEEEVNIGSGTYMPLNEDWYATLEYQGWNHVYCKTILTERFIRSHHSSEWGSQLEISLTSRGRG